MHATTATGDTALTYACENGHTDVADVLLQAGADLVSHLPSLKSVSRILNYQHLIFFLFLCLLMKIYSFFNVFWAVRLPQSTEVSYSPVVIDV